MIKVEWSLNENNFFCPICGKGIFNKTAAGSSCPHVFAVHMNHSCDDEKWIRLSPDFADRYRRQCLEYFASIEIEEREFDETEFDFKKQEIWPLLEECIEACGCLNEIFIQVVEKDKYYPTILTVGIRTE